MVEESKKGAAGQDFVKEITTRSTDFSRWYIDVIRKADLVDYAPVRGCMVIKPGGYAIWEKVQEGLDRRFKATGHRNAYFPLFIPESFVQLEKEHVEGFAPELPWVTEAGGEKLTERLAVRPTSETIICSMYAKWIQSYRDLPMLLNQWCNVVRWEKRTLPFLRTSEFLWQEGHTAHRTSEEAEEETIRMLRVYQDFVENDLAIPVIPGLKSDREKFAGAVRTYSIEAMMQDGKALQAGTSHFLGQNFAVPFNIQFLDADGQLKYVWQTSWGLSTRIIGALVMVHGDDRGLVIPPKAAEIQVVIVPIAPVKERANVLAEVAKVAAELGEVARVQVDDDEEHSPGWKFNEWELKGVPVRLEIGPRDLKAGQAVLVRRDTGVKEAVPLTQLKGRVAETLAIMQSSLLAAARRRLEEQTTTAGSYDEFKQVIEDRRGFVVAGWCGDAACEAKIKEETGATIRNLPLDQPSDAGTCLVCGGQAKHQAYFARAY
ncbi:MAG: proline--tRNA ligase [Bacillota bacterium]